MSLKKCFGIISWFPNNELARRQRQDRINRLLKQLDELWPDVDILIIAQNWKAFEPRYVRNNIFVIHHDEGLGILKARKLLREEFLKLNYDYIIMLDDDAIIKCDNSHSHIDFMNEIDKHPDCFCFIHAEKPFHRYDPYKSAQLNLCAISKYIYEKEDIPDIDPQKNEGYEDHVYSVLLHIKYADHEFNPPKTITHVQFRNKNESAPSTWVGKDTNARLLNKSINDLDDYIYKHKKLPDDLKKFLADVMKEVKKIEDPLKGPKEFKSYLDLFIN